MSNRSPIATPFAGLEDTTRNTQLATSTPCIECHVPMEIALIYFDVVVCILAQTKAKIVA